MKTKLLILSLLIGFSATAQLKLGNNQGIRNFNSILEMEHSTKGMLLPRVSLTSTTSYSPLSATIVAGFMVYNTNAAATAGSSSYPINTGAIGVYYWDGNGWVATKSTMGTVTGTGTVNYVPKWSSSTGLTNGLIFDNGTNIGIGTESPTGLFHIAQATPASVATTSVTATVSPLRIIGGNGGATSSNGGTVSAGNAGAIIITGGNGGATTGTPTTGIGGKGGNITPTAGDGGYGTTFGGAGGHFEAQAGNGGGGAFGGAAGYAALKAGNAGSTGNGAGGNVFLTAGAKNGSGQDGAIYIGVSPSSVVRGNVIIGASSDDLTNKLQVTGNSLFTGSITGTSSATYAGSVGVGTNTPSAAAQLDITSTSGGVLFPRMTTTQRDAISSPPDGLVVYNTTTGTFQGHASGAWTNLYVLPSQTGNSGKVLGTDGTTSSWVSANPAGSVVLWTTNSAPTGWLICDGSAVSRSTYSTLFAEIGTTYGSGDGSTTFNLPNLQGRVPVGRDSGQTEFDGLAETGGAKTHTLTETEIPSHRHGVNAFVETGDLNDPTGAYPAGTGASDREYKTSGTATTMNASMIGATGGGAAHNNLQPYIVFNYIIKI